MKSENGLTLVELLVTLVIIGITVALSMSIFMNGSNSAKRTTTNQKLQQEANYIVEALRSNYLKNEETDIELKINTTTSSLLMDGEVISQGYDYQFNEGTELVVKIDRKENVPFTLTIGRDDLSFMVDTTLSKIR